MINLELNFDVDKCAEFILGVACIHVLIKKPSIVDVGIRYR